LPCFSYCCSGYCGTIVSVSPIIGLEVGMSNENTVLVTIEVDTDAPENANPTAANEDTECIKVLLIPKSELFATLRHMAHNDKIMVDAKLYTYAMALSL